MNSQTLVIVLAAIIALFMMLKPELCIPNPKHRSPKMVRTIKYVGMSVTVVMVVWSLITLFR